MSEQTKFQPKGNSFLSAGKSFFLVGCLLFSLSTQGIGKIRETSSRETAPPPVVPSSANNQTTPSAIESGAAPGAPRRYTMKDVEKSGETPRWQDRAEHFIMVIGTLGLISFFPRVSLDASSGGSSVHINKGSSSSGGR